MNYLEHMVNKRHEIIKSGVLRKFPYLGATITNVVFEPSNRVKTAATDGRKVFYSEKFVESLSYDEKIFLFAHELMHIAFKHLLRRGDKDKKLWNIATDAVINQILKAENLPMPEGGVDIIGALYKSAEQVYNKLLEKREQSQNGQGQSGEGESEQGDGEYTPGEGGTGEHEIWDEAIKEFEESQGENGEKSGSPLEDLIEDGASAGEDLEKKQQEKSASGSQQNDEMKDDKREEDKAKDKKGNGEKELKDIEQEEKDFIDKNRKMKEELGKSIRDKMKSDKDSRQAGNTAGNSSFTLGAVDAAKPVISWKRILRREFELEEDRWSYRRANEENDYQARIGSFDVMDYPKTEVLLDTSGSVNEEMLRSFLRQLKPLLKESQIEVGCFDTRFYGFTEIKKSKDIDNLALKGRGGTSFDTALKSFSSDKDINKIIFTDGEDSVSNNTFNRNMKRVFWIVWGKRRFNPCCGKVIYVDPKEFSKFEIEDITMID